MENSRSQEIYLANPEVSIPSPFKAWPGSSLINLMPVMERKRRQRMMIALMELGFITILWPTQILAVEPCLSICGDVIVQFPFGIGKGCYMDENFEVTCNYSFTPPKPFLTSINMELLDISTTGQVQVSNPVIYSDCSSNKASNTTTVSLLGTPFVFSNSSSRFTALGCDNYARFMEDGGNIVRGCLSICPSGANASGCYGINCCQATIPPYVQFFEANMTSPFNSMADRSSCKSAFMVDQNWFAPKSSSSHDDLNLEDHVPAVLDWAADQGYCDISREPNINCTSSYCWKKLQRK